MKVSQAVKKRKSIRAFTNQPVPIETVKQVMEAASRAPSGGNVQPWRIVVLSEEKLGSLKALMETRLSGTPHPDGETPEYPVYPQKMKEPYRTVRYQNGEDLYALIGISREDKAKRLEWFSNNFRFFGAPAAIFCFVDRTMGAPQWSDLGMYLQTAMLLFQEEGIDTCAQECWSFYPKTIHDFCEMDDDLMLFCGMAIGHADETQAVNDLNTPRMPTDDWLKVL